MKTKWELTIYGDGVAILTDERGRTVWTSDGDDDFAAEDFPDMLTYDDGDDVAEYLIDCGLLDEDEELDIVEADDTGLHEVAHADGDDDEAEDDDDDDDTD